MLTANSNFRLRRMGGFTLIEMVVVIGIIAILMAAIVAVGSMVRTNVLRRHTLAELKLLNGVMKDYIDAGNAEPPATVSAWPYTVGASGNSPYARTNPDSDLTNWVAALQSYSKKLATLPVDTDANGVSSSGTTHPVILDAFGNPIRFVPSNPTTNTQFYFMSAGPDGKFSMQVNSDGSAVSGTAPRADEIYDYDPQ